MVPSWAKNILFLLVYMISGLVLVIIIEGLLSGSDLTPLNTTIETLVVEIRTPVLTTFMVLITKIGNPFFFSALSLFISIILVMKREVYDAALILITLMLSVVSFTVLKNIFQITRPDSPLYNVEGWSFPSGHATIATAFFFLIAIVFWKRVNTLKGKIFLVLGSILGALLVSFSRVYLGAHWTLDIMGGSALGLLTVSFTVLMFSLFLGEDKSLRKRIALW